MSYQHVEMMRMLSFWNKDGLESITEFWQPTETKSTDTKILYRGEKWLKNINPKQENEIYKNILGHFHIQWLNWPLVLASLSWLSIELLAYFRDAPLLFTNVGGINFSSPKEEALKRHLDIVKSSGFLFINRKHLAICEMNAQRYASLVT